MDSQFETGSQTSEQMSHSTTGAYFCSNCHYSISNEADYKKHYKSEFHRYNIKRRLVNLPPATFEQFLKRKNKAMESRVKSKESLIENYKCKQCNKSFGSKNTYEQHIKSKKHSKSEKVPEDSNNLEEEIPKEKPVKKEVKTTLQDINVCLFCNKQSDNLQSNLNHMRIQHSFFITDKTYCKKVEGLIGYLAEKINIGLLCLYCENQGIRDFKSADAVRSHMVDKGHCFMNTDHFDEYIKFYDFSEQFKGYELVSEKVKAKDKIAGEEYIQIVDEEGEEDGEWEEVDGENEDEEWEEEEEGENRAEGTTEDAENADTKKNREFFKAERDKKNKTKYVYLRVKKAKLLDTGEIELPSGKILGNRIYRHIYKQYYRNRASVVDRYKMILGHAMDVNQIALYRRNDQLILSSRVHDFKKRRHLNRIEDAYTRRQKAAHLDIGVKANKLQPHFKQQCPL